MNIYQLFPRLFGNKQTDFQMNGSTVSVKNVGDRDGDEVVQLYASPKKSLLVLSSERLVAFQRIHLRSGESLKVVFPIQDYSTTTFRVSTPELR